MKLISAVIGNAEQIGAAPMQNVANIIDGAQNGVGVNIPYIDGMQALVANPTFFVVTHYPAFFDLPGYELNRDVLKALIERVPTSVSGVDFSYTVNTAEAPIGHDTQQLSTPLNTVRSGVSPSFSIRELKGNLVNRFFTNWMFHIQHPDTNASIMSATHTDDQIPEWVVSTYSMAMAGLWFDETMLPDRMVDTAFYAAMFPFDVGELGFSRDIGQSKILDRTVNFKAIVQHNHNTRALGIYIPVSYNHLTLPTICSVSILVVAVTFITKKLLKLQKNKCVDIQT